MNDDLKQADKEAKEMIRIARMPHYHYDCGWHDGVKCMYRMVRSIVNDLDGNRVKFNDQILEKIYTEVRRNYMVLINELYDGYGLDHELSLFLRVNWKKSDPKKKQFELEWYQPHTPEKMVEALEIVMQEMMKPKSDILVNRPQDKKQ